MLCRIPILFLEIIFRDCKEFVRQVKEVVVLILLRDHNLLNSFPVLEELWRFSGKIWIQQALSVCGEGCNCTFFPWLELWAAIFSLTVCVRVRVRMSVAVTVGLLRWPYYCYSTSGHESWPYSPFVHSGCVGNTQIAKDHQFANGLVLRALFIPLTTDINAHAIENHI